MEERKTYTDEELSAVLEKHRVMLAVGTFIMYAAVAVILGGTLACAVFEIEELRFKKLLRSIKDVCDLADFEIEGRVVLIDKRSGRVWR